MSGSRFWEDGALRIPLADVAVSRDPLNRAVERGGRRAAQLEAKLASLIEPVLVRAGDRAARRVRARGTVVTAAGDWVPPAASEVLDVDELVRELRGKTDPVRAAVVETRR